MYEVLDFFYFLPKIFFCFADELCFGEKILKIFGVSIDVIVWLGSSGVNGAFDDGGGADVGKAAVNDFVILKVGWSCEGAGAGESHGKDEDNVRGVVVAVRDGELSVVGYSRSNGGNVCKGLA